MFFRRFARCHGKAGRRHFATGGGVRDVAMQRNKALQTSYPGLFNAGNFMKEQQKLVEGNFTGQKKMIDEWNKRALNMQDRGIRFFYEIGGAKSIEAHPEYQPPPEVIEKPEALTCPERDWATLEKRFEAGEKIIASVDWLKNETDTVFNSEHGQQHEKNLKLMDALDTLRDLETWQMRLQTEADEWKGCKLPASEHEYRMWLYEYKKTCERVGDQVWGSSTSHLIKWDKMNAEDTKALKAHIAMREEKFFNEVVKKNDPSCKLDKWMKYHEAMQDLFAPLDQDHYQWADQAQNMFRAAFWQGSDRPAKVEKELKAMVEFVATNRDSEIDLMRVTYEKYPDLKFRPEASQRIQARDLTVMPKMLKEIRDKVEQSTFQRSIRDILKPHQEILFAAERKGLNRGLEKRKTNGELEKLDKSLGGRGEASTLWSEAGVFRKHMTELDAEEKAFNAEPLTVEQVAADVVPRFCWTLPDDKRKAAIDKFTQQVVQYTKKGGKLDALNKAYWDLMPHSQGEAFDARTGVGPQDHDHIKYFVKYDEVRESHPEYWSAKALFESDEWEFSGGGRPGGNPFSEEGIMNNVRHAQEKLSQFDPICLNLVKVLLEEGGGDGSLSNASELETIYLDYCQVGQKFAGEVHGTITGAEDMSEKEFNQIMAELKKANPTKKFFLEKKTDPSLMAGFVVKAGVQTLDFSLLSEVEKFKTDAKSGK